MSSVAGAAEINDGIPSFLDPVSVVGRSVSAGLVDGALTGVLSSDGICVDESDALSIAAAGAVCCCCMASCDMMMTVLHTAIMAVTRIAINALLSVICFWVGSVLFAVCSMIRSFQWFSEYVIK